MSTIHLSEREAEKLGLKTKRHKYFVRKDDIGKLGRTIDGVVFDSQAEANRYCQLKQLEQLGQIWNLELQPTYKLVVNDVHICDYKADFQYRAIGLGRGLQPVVEDVKGVKTAAYKLKRKLMQAIHGIRIQEI